MILHELKNAPGTGGGGRGKDSHLERMENRALQGSDRGDKGKQSRCLEI